MIDIHSHFLPGLDDGARTVEEARAMIEMAIGDGITHLVATPHCNDRYPFSLERNLALLEELRPRAPASITLLSGCDFHLSYENVQAALAEPRAFTINQGTYLLTEFDNFSIAPQMVDVFYQLRAAGLVPVITHPERIPILQKTDTRLLRRLAAMGCPIQVTAGSLTGCFGPVAKEMTQRLFREQLVHLVASDAHDTDDRPPRLSEARALVEKEYGAELAEALFVDNPRAAIESQPLPYFPEATEPKKKRFWFF
ncbi:MAG TPA: CpsB/CapC family capsule biosynthesis tyrosine phosphatase [Candidatus Xenobia bacterium]|nr:CpsB/CapC family capsule biosynthesis tyrosine phosphatase [Candidatus Xenobia bacterium]